MTGKLTLPTTPVAPPIVWLIGEVDHPELRPTVSLVRAGADATCVADGCAAAERLVRAARPPELIVLAASRPGVIRTSDVEHLRRRAPLAGIVALLGTWCEGETRTGRPWPGVGRLYWYEFGPWWRRQLARRADGRCPEWALADEFGLAIADCGLQRAGDPAPGKAVCRVPAPTPTPAGLVVLDTTCWETANALSDVLRSAGFTTAWTNSRSNSLQVRGAVAGIWEGRQLDDAEARRLAGFCRRLEQDEASVLALLDFPRRDRCALAERAGADAVLGKPWLNVELLATLQQLVDEPKRTTDAVARAA